MTPASDSYRDHQKNKRSRRYKTPLHRKGDVLVVDRNITLGSLKRRPGAECGQNPWLLNIVQKLDPIVSRASHAVTLRAALAE